MGYSSTEINDKKSQKSPNAKESKNILNYDPNDVQGIYLGGLLKFETKIYWLLIAGLIPCHIGGLYGFWLSILEIMQFRIITTVYAYFLVVAGCVASLGGAHRLWSHKSFKAKFPLKVFLMIVHTMSGQLTIHRWAREHRLHHKYVDTNADPFNASRGLFFSHVGWMCLRRHPECEAVMRTVNIDDLNNDPVVMFQKRHFLKLYVFLGFLLPVTIPCIFWGETIWNSIFIAYFFAFTLGMNSAFSINSLAHTYGCKPYDKNIRATENPLVSFLSQGEGWHNFHHTFPWDYKASEFGKNFNLTGNFIDFCARMGWAYDLKVASPEMIMRKISRSGDGTYHFEDAKEERKKADNS